MLMAQPPSSTLQPGYLAGRTGAALRREHDHARLWLAGADRIPFLQRISTNDVRLAPGQGTVTVLTSPTARIIAVLTVQAHPDGLLLVAGPGQGPTVYNTLRGQIFFQDRVTVEGRGSAMAQFGLYGPQSATVLARAGFPDAENLPLFAWRSGQIGAAAVTVQRIEGLGSQAFTVLTAAANGSMVEAALLQAGAVSISEEAYHTLRIEAGVPAPGYELTDQVNPLEAGLRRFCNDHKGCYTGQEIIARQITYDKVTTHLVGLLPERPVTANAAVQAEGRQVGWVSSVALSPALGRPIALAFVRRPHHEPGTPVAVADAEGPVPARVTALPFVG
ncbi:MAG: glycine cleavage T C-terminal barrel domain-containing protein [Anaerolineae bacterium]|nr:glycine cleavage T C-terminal barrel domain-containing protein [Anaerolineae bacterium]